MAAIHVLSDTLINQIAAGEVVERPASVIKELLENALDAGATVCRLEIEQGGISLIKVQDNGCGMDEVDARMAFERHATSKISTQEDLSRIQSFGFRGEALAAIASVAIVKLQTRLHAEVAGRTITSKGGVLQESHAVGCPPGTTIEVRNLFFNTPARKKFLKSETTELSNIVRIHNHIALSHPSVSFECIHNGKSLSKLPATSDLKERAQGIIGRTIIKDLLPVDFKTPSIHIHGYIASPGAAYASRRHQYLFVNARDVNDPIVSRAVSDAYGSRIPGRMYPVFILSIDLAPGDVDVNVHPRKMNVKFLEPNRMYRDVKQAVLQSLEDHQKKMFSPGPSLSEAKPLLPRRGGASLPHDSYSHDFPAASADGATVQDALNFSRDFALDARSLAPREQKSLGTPADPLILSQIANSYILILEEEGLAILDQHAAHERILYERLKNQMSLGSPLTQPLLIPLSLECDSAQILYLKNALTLLTHMGFEFDTWSGKTVVVQSCPALLASENLGTVLRDFIEEMMHVRPAERLLPETILKSLACKSAVKFGMSLSVPEQKRLLQDLAVTENSSTCPHGRPTKILMSFEELERRFYRRK